MLSPLLLVVICFAGVLCVAPVAFYLCWLASVNRRDHPTVVAGAWDFAGVVAALSGFLLVGGLLLLSIVQNDPRLFTGGDFTALRTAWEAQWLAWIVVFVGYLGLIVLVVTMTVRGKAGSLSVYNIDPDAAANAVEGALSRAGLVANRRGNLWADHHRQLVELAPFHGTHHATVHVLCPDRRERDEIERHLRDHLVRTLSPDNPAAAWFSTLAGGTVLAVVGFVALIAYTLFLRG